MKSKPVPDPVLSSEQESEPEDFVKLVKSIKGKKTATEHYIEEEEENEEWLEGKEDGEGEWEEKEDGKCHEDCLNFANFVKLLKGKQKATECCVEGEGGSEEEEEWEEDEKEGEEDELDSEEEKPHEDRKAIYKPRKERNVNRQPCDTCAKRGKVCHMQDAIKAKACYECGILKLRCIFTVSFLYFKK